MVDDCSMTTPPLDPAAPSPSKALVEVVLELEQYAAEQGWDQGPRLFALIRTADLVEREPQLAKLLNVADGTGPEFTSLEQTDLPPYASLEEMLGEITLGEGVAGAALVVERVMLPPGADEDLPDDENEALALLANHPGREEMRLVVGVLRDGTRHCALRLRSKDSATDVLTGPDLTPNLPAQLLALLQP